MDMSLQLRYLQMNIPHIVHFPSHDANQLTLFSILSDSSSESDLDFDTDSSSEPELSFDQSFSHSVMDNALIATDSDEIPFNIKDFYGSYKETEIKDIVCVKSMISDLSIVRNEYRDAKKITNKTDKYNENSQKKLDILGIDQTDNYVHCDNQLINDAGNWWIAKEYFINDTNQKIDNQDESDCDQENNNQECCSYLDFEYDASFIDYGVCV